MKTTVMWHRPDGFWGLFMFDLSTEVILEGVSRVYLAVILFGFGFDSSTTWEKLKS